MLLSCPETFVSGDDPPMSLPVGERQGGRRGNFASGDTHPCRARERHDRVGAPGRDPPCRAQERHDRVGAHGCATLRERTRE
ncbi:MAG: hypothetical protein GDA56_20235 [Hormoscilla sp. GM7CHS1pb]|nr:hypothetical protein [Hormoscilla sp. GM7CHS1pb]